LSPAKPLRTGSMISRPSWSTCPWRSEDAVQLPGQVFPFPSATWERGAKRWLLYP